MDTSRVDGVKAPQTPKFKIQDTEPDARSSLRIMSFWPNLTIWQLRDAWPSLCRSQEMPWSWGSIINGHLAVLETIEPFSVDTGSAGSVSWFQLAIS